MNTQETEEGGKPLCFRAKAFWRLGYNFLWDTRDGYHDWYEHENGPRAARNSRGLGSVAAALVWKTRRIGCLLALSRFWVVGRLPLRYTPAK